MRKALDSFRGEAPRMTPRGLPDNAAGAAVNAKLLRGDLEAWRQFAMTHGLHNAGPVLTLSRIGAAPGAWMSWDTDVDVARGTTPGDTTYRTYLTGPDEYDEPRFTTYAMATTGAEPYPVTTRPLGVPAPESAPTLAVGIDPTATTFSLDVLDEGDALTNWTLSSQIPGTSTVAQDAGVGHPLPSYQMFSLNNAGSPTFLYRNFSIGSPSVIHYSFDVYLTGAQQLMAPVAVPATGSGLAVFYGNGAFSIGTMAGWTGYGSAAVVSAAVVLSNATWYTVDVQIVLNADNTYSVTAQVSNGSAQLAAVNATMLLTLGDYCGFVNQTTAGAVGNWIDNIHAQASGSTGYTPTNLATSYVFTFVNDLAQESAPSLPSSTILRPDGISVTVTTATAVPSGVSADYGITTKRIYRAVSGSSGTAYQFVAEIPLGTADYVDVLTDAELGEVLPSELWALPPDDLEGILALPNGVMAGFSKNQLCLSAQNHPHAWPVEYRLNTDTQIVGIGNVDTTVVIGTESFVYVASGNDPAAYSMSKTEVPYACSSKRSVAYLTGVGVVFAGPDGLMAVAGVGQVRNLTEPAFTRDQWQALKPSSMRAVAHNDIYWLFYDTGTVKGCYAIDMKQTGFGIVEMAFHASAAYVDPVEDKMYLVLDEVDEPTDTYLPLPANPPAYANGTTVYEFEGAASEKMVYRYRSKLWLLDHPSYLSIAQVKAEDFDNLLVRFYADGDQIHEETVAGEAEFTLPAAGGGDGYTTFEIELLGTSTVRVVQAADDVNELG